MNFSVEPLKNFSAAEVVVMLDLTPLPNEGGWFRRTYADEQCSTILYLMAAGDGVAGEAFALDGSECRAAIGEGIDADAEPRHADAAENAHHGAGQNHKHLVRAQPMAASAVGRQESEVGDDDGGDEQPQHTQKF